MTPPLEKGRLGASVLGRRMLHRSFWSVLLVSALVIAAQSLVVMQQKREQRFRTVDDTAAILLPNIASASWQVSEATMATLLDSLVALEGATAARFEDGYLRVERHTPRPTASELDWRSCERVIRRDLRGFPLGSEKLPAGLLEICFVQPASLGSLLPDALVAAAPLLVLLLLASVYPAMLVHRMVIRPIGDLTDAIRRSRLLGFVPQRPPKDRGDEVDVLVEELKERTIRLLQEQGMSDLAFHALSDGMAVADQQLVVQRYNAAMATALGLAPSERLEGRSLRDYLPAEAFVHPDRPLEFSGPGARVLEVSSSPLNFEGAPAHRVYQVRDLTDKKRHEAEVRQANKMNALGTLSGGVAHDFNNLLMAIGGNAELIGLDEKLSPEGQRMLGVIRQAARRGSALTAQLLSFARKQPMKIGSLGAREVVTEVAALSRRTLGSGHRVEVRIGEDCWVRTDRTLLDTALINLLVNARDAQPQGGVIQLVVEPLEGEAQPLVRLSVLNEGPDIPREVLDRMGEPFFTTKGPGKGTGLGLSMVMGFAAQSGGRFEMHSAHGHTRMSIVLPRAMAPDARELDGAGAPPIAGASRSLAVLLVDDDLTVRETLAGLLRSLGHRVEQAGSAAEVQVLVVDHGPVWDVVLCDMVLAHGSGLDVQHMLQSHGANMPCVFISGNVPEALSARMGSQDLPDVLFKPVSRERLQAALAAACPPAGAAP